MPTLRQQLLETGVSDPLGHGQVGKHEQPFTHLLELRAQGYDVGTLASLAFGMKGIPDKLSDGGDPEENLYMPAGYTYFGQFIDHDLTFDTTSTLSLDPRNLADPNQDPSNVRSPRFDLDCVYGNGPGDQPYLYAQDNGSSRGVRTYSGASLLLGGDVSTVARISDKQEPDGAWDLQRGPNGRALIGDKRNDENSIVNQIQQMMIMFHNKIVSVLANLPDAPQGNALFQRARDEVCWAYQKIILEDYLPRIIDSGVLDNFVQTYAARGDAAYKLYKPGPLRNNLPREFVAAAYRFGHSAIRQGYRLNTKSIRSIFLPDAADGKPDAHDSLIGFDPLPQGHAIDDWGRFFPVSWPMPGERRMGNDDASVDIETPFTGPDDAPPGDPKVRLQYAYKLDPSIVDPLTDLPNKIASKRDVAPPSVEASIPTAGPSLALLNLLRGNRYGIQGGQSFEPILGIKLDAERYLRVRTLTSGPDQDKTYTFKHISELKNNGAGPAIGPALNGDTPLWFYILAEAQKPLVDFWYDNAQQPLTENQLKGLDPNGSAPPRVEPPNPAMTIEQLKQTRCGGTRLGEVGGRIVAEVFYGLLDSDADSLFNRAPGGSAGWEPMWTNDLGTGPATFAKLVQFVALSSPSVVISDSKPTAK